MTKANKYTGFTMSRAPGMKPVVRMLTQDSPRVRVPDELPTYSRLRVMHCGIPEDEVRMWAASLEESCFHSETGNPVSAELIDSIFRSAAVSEPQAEEIREFIRSQDSEYLQDEARLLLEAAGHQADA